ncbi:hypothetical protein TWF696_005842 [Orbilia brochopaga]|uniref:Myb-like domain-containing protein n=1 Tax=Orbilia brochopaga TaxID=3140254 RepID=A0AAV9UVP4_9PEZI
MSVSVKRERELSPPIPDLSVALNLHSPKLETNSDGNEDVTSETQAPKKRARKNKTTTKEDNNGSSKGKRGVWTDEQDSALHALITNNEGGNEVKAPWSETFERFKGMFPDADKTLNSLQMRWKQKLRGGDTDLSFGERILFKQAVANVDGSERALAYAWRFKELSGKDLNKSAAAKLYKMLKSGQLGTDDWQVKSE